MPARFALLAFTLALLPAQAQTSPASTSEPPTSGPQTTPDPGPLTAQVNALLRAPAVAHAHWGISVRSMDGTPLLQVDAGKLFRPASTAKLFTTAAAMALLGPKATTTSLVYYPPPVDGEVHGDLNLVSYNDPDLSAVEPAWEPPTAPKQAEPDPLRGVRSFASELKARGLRHITGGVVAGSIWDPYPQGWEQEDLLWGYGAPVSSLSINDNQLHFVVTAGATAGDPATVTLTPDTGYYRIASTVRTLSSDSTPEGITLHHDPGDGTLRIAGSLLPRGTYETEIAIDDPPLFAARALRQALLDDGITVDGAATAPREEPLDVSFQKQARTPISLEIYKVAAAGSYLAGQKPISLIHTSQSLSADIVGTLKESQNLHAELILRRVGDSRLDSSTVSGAQVVHQWLVNAGIPDSEFVFYDGSGLSTKDLVAPDAEVQLLLYASHQPWFAQWKTALPVGGVDGTLRSRFTEAPFKGHLFAKTGTLGESRALAGYLQCRSGRLVAFSIMVDDHMPGLPADRKAMDEIVAAIAATN